MLSRCDEKLGVAAMLFAFCAAEPGVVEVVVTEVTEPLLELRDEIG